MTILLIVLSALALSSTTIAAVFALALRRATARGDLAMERLVQARKDGYAIPTAEDVAPATAADGPEFDPRLQALIDDWDTPAGREAQTRMIRSQLALGFDPAAIVRTLSPQPPSE